MSTDVFDSGAHHVTVYAGPAWEVIAGGDRRRVRFTDPIGFASFPLVTALEAARALLRYAEHTYTHDDEAAE